MGLIILLLIISVLFFINKSIQKTYLFEITTKDNKIYYMYFDDYNRKDFKVENFLNSKVFQNNSVFTVQRELIITEEDSNSIYLLDKRDIECIELIS